MLSCQHSLFFFFTMKLIIFRHGQTEENVAWVLQWHMPWVLTQTWKLQAQHLAERLQYEEIDHIYTSDLARAADTATAVAQYHPAATYTPTEKLREMNAWTYTWQIKADIPWYSTINGLDKPSVETNEQWYMRAQRFLTSLISHHPNDTVAISTHSWLMRFYYLLFHTKSLDDLGSLDTIPNTAISIVEIDASWSINIIVYNDAEHLA